MARKKKKKQKVTLGFAQRLQALGYASYRDYLNSDYWLGFKDRYRKSALPKECVGCGETPIQLHHVTYARLGRERLHDILPLCEGCHTKVHHYAKENKVSIRRTDSILAEIYGWTVAEMKEHLAGFPCGNELFDIDSDEFRSRLPEHLGGKPVAKPMPRPKALSGREVKIAAARFVHSALIEALARMKTEDREVRREVRIIMDDFANFGKRYISGETTKKGKVVR